DFIDGTGTINGSVVASANDKLLPGAAGIINKPPYKWTNTQYQNAVNSSSTPFRERMRPAYSSASHGAPGSTSFESWRDMLFQSDGIVSGSKVFGAVLEDSSGSKAWENASGTPTTTLLDPRPAEEIIMPDLQNFGSVTDPADAGGLRFAKSKAYVD